MLVDLNFGDVNCHASSHSKLSGVHLQPQSRQFIPPPPANWTFAGAKERPSGYAPLRFNWHPRERALKPLNDVLTTATIAQSNSTPPLRTEHVFRPQQTWPEALPSLCPVSQAPPLLPNCRLYRQRLTIIYRGNPRGDAGGQAADPVPRRLREPLDPSQQMPSRLLLPALEVRCTFNHCPRSPDRTRATRNRGRGNSLQDRMLTNAIFYQCRTSDTATRSANTRSSRSGWSR